MDYPHRIGIDDFAADSYRNLDPKLDYNLNILRVIKRWNTAIWIRDLDYKEVNEQYYQRKKVKVRS